MAHPVSTGKTTTLTKRVQATAQARGKDKVLVVSFTKTAAKEAAGRDLGIPDKMVGTLHSMAFRALGQPTVVNAVIKDWNDRHPRWSIGRGGGDIEEAPADWGAASDGEKLLAQLDIMRARMVPPELYPQHALRSFAAAWEAWKTEVQAVDFSDMIEHAKNETTHAPGNPEVIFLDEGQDSTPTELELIHKWANAADRLIVFSDDDQAQAPETRVLTTKHGWVEMQHLDPETHRLTTYDLRSGRVLDRGHVGSEFKIAHHPHEDRSLRVEAAGRQTICTPEHRWWVKHDRQKRLNAVYLMRKGDWWRVGWCQMTRADGVDHLGTRARLEGADALWVLSTHEDRTAASMEESWVAANYGLPTATFRAVDGAKHFTAESLTGLFTRLEGVMGERARNVLEDHGRMVEHPFWQPGRNSIYGKQISQIRACNLISGWHQVPTVSDDRESAWSSVNVSNDRRLDAVYSIGVEPDRTYIVDGGIVTSNCLYRFRGADAHSLIGVAENPEDKIVLDHSYRCPPAIVELADTWVKRLSKREPKFYLPRGVLEDRPWTTEQGEVVWSNTAFDAGVEIASMVEEEIAMGRDVMVISSCGYQLDPVKAGLRGKGIPYFNPYRPQRGDWNPMKMSNEKMTSAADRVLAYLVLEERDWTGADIKAWSKYVKAKGVFRRGAKGAIDGLPDRELTFEEVAQLFDNDKVLEEACAPSLDWYMAHLSADGERALEFPVTVLRQHGVAALKAEPQVVLGTIHSVKGGAADTVILSPDLSAAAMREWGGTAEQQDSIIRQYYVAMTRAREKLIVTMPFEGSQNAVPLRNILSRR